MRHLDIIVPASWMLSEAKARIDHPEDLVFDEGSRGAKRALKAMTQAAASPHVVTIKWDGSPALIFGRDDRGFTLTDKSGFSSRKPGGLPRSPAELKNMLWMRRPDDPTREAYANSIAGMWNEIARILPADFQGFIMGDLLWSKTPNIIDGNYVFKPNKISYSIPTDSNLGQKIANSQIGIAVHSRLSSQDDADSRSIGDIDALGLIDNDDVVVMGPSIRDLEHTHLPDKLVSTMTAVIARSAAQIDQFLDPGQLSKNQISDLPAKLKQYANQRAGAGQAGFADAADGFIKWINGPTSKLTDRKRDNFNRWIAAHNTGHAATWAVADQLARLKDFIRHDVDRQVGTNIRASLDDKPGHEGYVADTPSGKIKFVDRPTFMRKDSEDALS